MMTSSDLSEAVHYTARAMEDGPSTLVSAFVTGSSLPVLGHTYDGSSAVSIPTQTVPIGTLPLADQKAAAMVSRCQAAFSAPYNATVHPASMIPGYGARESLMHDTSASSPRSPSSSPSSSKWYKRWFMQPFSRLFHHNQSHSDRNSVGVIGLSEHASRPSFHSSSRANSTESAQGSSSSTFYGDGGSSRLEGPVIATTPIRSTFRSASIHQLKQVPLRSHWNDLPRVAPSHTTPTTLSSCEATMAGSSEPGYEPPSERLTQATSQLPLLASLSGQAGSTDMLRFPQQALASTAYLPNTPLASIPVSHTSTSPALSSSSSSSSPPPSTASTLSVLATTTATSSSMPGTVASAILSAPLAAANTPRIGPYYIYKTIGYGSFSKVKAGRHMETGQWVALKMIPREALLESAALRRSLFLEIQLLRRIHHSEQSMFDVEGHVGGDGADGNDFRPRDHIVQLYQVLLSKHYLTLVLEWIPGQELFSFVSERGRLSEDMARNIFRPLAATVQYLHRLGIIHRDLKLENVLIQQLPSPSAMSETPALQVKLIDFGLATLLLPPSDVQWLSSRLPLTAASPASSHSSSSSGSRVGANGSNGNINGSSSPTLPTGAVLQQSNMLTHWAPWRAAWEEFESSLLGSSSGSPSSSLSPMTHVHSSNMEDLRASKLQPSPPESDEPAHREQARTSRPSSVCTTAATDLSSELSTALSRPPSGPMEVLLLTRCGSEEYAPPELLRGLPYQGRVSDVWSLGILLYAIVMGALPFQPTPGKGRASLLHNICRGQLTWPSPSPPMLTSEPALASPPASSSTSTSTFAVSKEFMQLVRSMLSVFPSERTSLDEALSSPWMNMP